MIFLPNRVSDPNSYTVCVGGGGRVAFLCSFWKRTNYGNFDFMLYWLSQRAILGKAGIWLLNKSSFTFNFFFSLALGNNPLSPGFPSDIPFAVIVKLPGGYKGSLWPPLHDTQLIFYSLSFHCHLSASFPLLLGILIPTFWHTHDFYTTDMQLRQNHQKHINLHEENVESEKRKWCKNKDAWCLFPTKDKQNQIGDVLITSDSFKIQSYLQFTCSTTFMIS